MFPDLETDDPSALDPADQPDADVETDEVEDNEERQSKPKNGAEARINELVATTHDLKRQLEEARAQTLLHFAALAQGQTRQPEPEPEPEPDWSDPSAVAKYQNRRMEKLEQGFIARTNQLQRQLEGSELERAVAAKAQEHGLDGNKVGQLARKLRAKNIPVDADELIQMEIGAAVMAGTYKAPAAVSRGGSNAPLSSVRAPNLAPAPSKEIVYPADFDSWSPSKRIAFLEKKGVGNKGF